MNYRIKIQELDGEERVNERDLFYFSGKRIGFVGIRSLEREREREPVLLGAYSLFSAHCMLDTLTESTGRAGPNLLTGIFACWSLENKNIYQLHATGPLG